MASSWNSKPFFDTSKQEWINLDEKTILDESIDDLTKSQSPLFNIEELTENSLSLLDHESKENRKTDLRHRRNSFDCSLNEPFPVNYSKASYSKTNLPKYIRKDKNIRSKSYCSPVCRRVNQPLLRSSEKSSSVSNLSTYFSSSPMASNLNKNKSYSSGNISLKSDYSNVQSKVKAYIESVKALPSKKPEESLSMGQKSLSMSNIHNPYLSSTSNLKSFLSYVNLNDVTVTLSKFGKNLQTPKSSFDSSRLSRLLDNLSDDDIGDEENEDEEVVIDVEDILQLAIQERRDKRNAKKILSQLQCNYDKLQQKYAQAENIIDKLRFGKIPEEEAFFKNEFSSPTNGSSKSSDEALIQSTKDQLKDIQDQLYGLELVSGSLDLVEKDRALSEIKETFHKLIISTESQKGVNIMDDSQMDGDVVKLLKEIGKKLYRKDFKLTGATEEFDPIEKVSDWKMCDSGSGGKLPSCYGSLSTSPLLGASVSHFDRIHGSLNLGDFDSGCPGSDRSVCSKTTVPKIIQGEEEEEEENSSLSLPSEVLGDNEEINEDGERVFILKRSPLPPRKKLHCITDESEEYDDKDVFDPEFQRLLSSTKKALISSTPTKYHSQEKNDTQPRILAKQIDEEIHELRAFFEDHRDEMMSLLHETNLGEKSISVSHLNSSFPRLTSPHLRYHNTSQSLRRGHTGLREEFQRKIEVSESDISLDNMKELRRKEFELRRKSKHKKKNSQNCDKGDNYEVNGSSSANNISSLYSHESINRLPEHLLQRSMEYMDQNESLNSGNINIPKLELDNLWTTTDDQRDKESQTFESIGIGSKAFVNKALSSSKSTKKNNKEMEKLLKYLEMANLMATKLKERSEEMLTLLKTETQQCKTENSVHF